ncbi:WhiB family transcriptional regulator [Streptomyces triticirhizae]|uniref:WhiB family transcriptional regulator n=1 Tax=Streptomyces triticirhizae TaxID=2483353 RepID=UPI0018F4AC74|nr:WhiB family transcriptional regulator [Streptomyces triticirhizae]
MDAIGRPQAACTGLDPRAFFTTASAPSDRPTHAERYALVVCATCPIRTSCLIFDLEAASDVSDVNGVFGGLREAERREIIRQRIQRRRAAKDAE